MIIIRQVRRDMSQVHLLIEYDDQGETRSIWVEAQDLVERFKQFRCLLGRNPSPNERKEILIQAVNELRRGWKPFTEIIQWEAYIGQDLEAG